MLPSIALRPNHAFLPHRKFIAQVLAALGIIDQLVTTAEKKGRRLSGLVMRLMSSGAFTAR